MQLPEPSNEPHADPTVSTHETGGRAPHEVPRRTLRSVLGPLGFIGLALLKFGKIAFIAVKGLKFFGTAFSMLVSIGAYSLFYGWRFAVGFVVLLFVHELGHALQLKREGIASSAPMFIPFLGAFIAMRELPKDAAMEARVGIAGPLLGSLGALAVHGAAIALDSNLLLAVAFTGYFLNLFNLVPVSPLDGGRIAAALSPKLWLAGLIVLLGLFLLSPNPILLIIVLLGGFDSWRRWRSRGETPEYYRDVSSGFRMWLGVTWIALVVVLVLLMQASHVPLGL